jgi:hypothetical protein
MAKSEDAAAQITVPPPPPSQRLINRDSPEFLENLFPNDSNHHQHCLQTMCTVCKVETSFQILLSLHEFADYLIMAAQLGQNI